MTSTTVASIFNGTTAMLDPGNETKTCSGIILPVLNESDWSVGARAFLYLFGLLWCFLAVAIIADIFMCSIERITSKTTIVRVPDANAEGGIRELEVKVWNDTVANLTLLALGTSAPEILLSVIELVANEFKAGALGPGTIVGSAAFNLLVISGICVMSIPEGEIRRVKSVKVFAVTAFSCVFAYVWLAIVLMAITPNVVDIWEAVLTLLFFPILILVAYVADKDFCMKKKKRQAQGFVGISLKKYTKRENGETSDDKDAEEGQAQGDQAEPSDEPTHGDAEILSLAKELGHIEELPEEEAAKIAAKKIAENTHHGRGWYRINASRMLTGGKKLMPQVLSTFQDLYETVQLPEEERAGSSVAAKSVDHSDGGRKPVIEFTAAGVAVMENEGKVRVGIKRSGKLDVPVTVRVETINGTALAGEDYKAFDEPVSFAANEILRQVYIDIVDDFEWEPDEFFFVKLIPIDGESEIALGNIAICQITIINDDEPGVLEFSKPSIVIKESMRWASIPVTRKNGADGHVSVTWKTKDITAIDKKDFEGGSGELKFDNQETSKTIDLRIFDSNKPERDESFQVELLETDGGATMGKIAKCIITIVNDDEFNGLVSRIVNLTKANLDSLQLEKSTYVTQFKNAMNVNGGDVENATFLDYILHFCTFFWKVLFAFVPPTQYLGGWPTFLISLGVIGFLTAIIADLAGIFGCLINLDDSITAITLVALGTSMPDTFASKTAAVMEVHADSSVGNVNGSNSVNVFLGLGLPWVIATIYWAVREKQFDVPSGNLGFSVILYTVCAIIALLLLVTRRNVGFFGKAELGGPKIPKIICGIILICLWVIYVTFSSLQSSGVIKVEF